ncbi:MAG TPA: HAD family hydrolase [Thermoanaerobaculia bacterium]|nr:HAD family hydrolase [Thermoanaerobaculia bacterium]
MIEAVTFDVTGTLIHCPRLGELYAEVLSRHGIAVSPREAGRLVRLVWQELACSADPGRDRFRSHPEGARGFWQRVIERIAEHLEAPVPSRFAAAELFHRFGSPEAWEVYPEVRGVLAGLKEQGLRLAVISNWDERLPLLLEQLALTPFFDAVTASAAGVADSSVSTARTVAASKADQRRFIGGPSSGCGCPSMTPCAVRRRQPCQARRTPSGREGSRFAPVTPLFTRLSRSVVHW